MSFFKSAEGFTPARANRIAVATRLHLPMYDVQQLPTFAVSVFPKWKGLAVPSPDPGLLLTAETAIVQIDSVTLVNSDAVARPANLWIVPSGGDPALAYQVWAESLPANSRVVVRPPWFLGLGETIHGSTTAANVVSFQCDYIEYDANPDSILLRSLTGGLLSAADASFYSVAPFGITQAILLSTTLCNVSGATATATVYRAPNTAVLGSLGMGHYLLREPVISKETILDDTPYILRPGDFIAGKASAIDSISARFSVLELV
jgi:hypothetical protein